MLNFDFIVDADFRSTLESDYAELIANVEAGSWKSAQVVAGSIIEAVLIDYLVASPNEKRTQQDPLRLDLADAIAIAKVEGILTDRTADLSSVVRSYRNLIHPGRAKRLSEPAPTESSASIAKNLVDLIVREIAKARRSTFGLTADQIVNKIETDAGSLAILKLLLRDVHAGERARLLTEALPKRYTRLRDAATDTSDDATLARLAAAFRVAYRMVGDVDVRKRLAAKFVTTLREASGAEVREYRDAFFLPTDIEYVEERYRALIKKHYLTNSPKYHNKESAVRYAGLAPYLEVADVTDWVDPFVPTLMGTAGVTDEERSRVRDTFIEAVVFRTAEEIHTHIHGRLNVWKISFQAKSQPEKVELIVELQIALEPGFSESPT